MNSTRCNFRYWFTLTKELFDISMNWPTGGSFLFGRASYVQLYGHIVAHGKIDEKIVRI